MLVSLLSSFFCSFPQPLISRTPMKRVCPCSSSQGWVVAGAPFVSWWFSLLRSMGVFSKTVTFNRRAGALARGRAAMKPPVRCRRVSLRSFAMPFSFGFIFGIFTVIAFLSALV